MNWCMFFPLWLFIGLVEVYDIYWLVKLEHCIEENELNPVGLALISIDGGSVALFTCAKVAGILLLFSVLPYVFYFRPKIGSILLALTCVAKLTVLLFLEYGCLMG